jgi:hypothetical protein
VCFIVHKTISKLEHTILITMFLSVQKTPTEPLHILSISNGYSLELLQILGDYQHRYISSGPKTTSDS